MRSSHLNLCLLPCYLQTLKKKQQELQARQNQLLKKESVSLADDVSRWQ